jgi:diguanylate cyclase (GGDEF)-like protein
MDLSITKINRLDDDETVFVGVLHDITAHKATEDELRRASYTDQLTGLPNRRHFRDYLNVEWSRAARMRTPLTLAMVDIDFFKRFNDTYGHQAGDTCLVDVAQCLKRTSRRTADLTARYGGEEFVVVLPDVEREAAAQHSEKLRAAVEALQVPNDDSEAARVVTISVGVATTVPDEHHSIRTLIEAADKALYQAKSGGRNRVVQHPEEMLY